MRSLIGDTNSQVAFVNLFGGVVAAHQLSVINYTWPKHFHDHFVIATTLDGVGQFKTDRGRFVAKADDVIIFNPGEVHDGGTGNLGTWNYLSLQIPASTMETLFRSTFDKKAPEIVFPLSCFPDMEISRLLKRLHPLETKALDQAALDAQFIRLTEALFSRHLTVEIAINVNNISIDSLAKVVDYMQLYYNKNISIRDLAKITGLSENYFISAFRKRYGMPPHAYLNQVRVHSAVRDIQRGVPIVKAATQAGFYDQSHFHRYLRRMYCVTPGQYMAAVSKMSNVSAEAGFTAP